MLKRAYRRFEEEYFVDWNTVNTSFLKIAYLLERSGIRNYDYHLRLYDEDLVDVDPYDPDITPEEMGKVAVEISRNYFYFLREVARVPEEGASTDVGGGIPFQLHRGNLAQAWCFEHNISHYLVLPRQFGKTTGAVQRYLWQFCYGTTSSTTIFMNMDKTASVSNLTRLKESRSLLPLYLQMNINLDDKGNLKKDIDNVNEVKNKTLKNVIITKAGARNVPSAERVGRGLSVPSLWFDEYAHILLNDVIHAAAIPAYSKASENAAKNDKPYAICITTTPGDLGTQHGKYAYEIMEKAGVFTESLYDYDADELDTWMTKNSSNNLVKIQFTFLQLGRTMEWFEKQCKDMSHNWMKIRRELLLQWNKASNNSPFAPEDIDELDTIAKAPIKTIKINKYYEVLLYKELDPMKRYLVGVDVSKGVGRDSSAVAIVDSKTLEVVGLFINNAIGSRELRRFLLTLILDHLPNSVLIIESNNIGSAIIEELKHSPLKHNLYYDFAYRLAEDNRKKGIVQAKNKNKLVYGHEVTSNTRPRMMDLLLQFVAKHKKRIAVKELVEQIRHLEYKNEERIDHASGHHDDAVFAYLACIYTMFYGKNLPRFGLFNSFNFEDGEIEERDNDGEDKLDKIFKRLKVQEYVRQNPYLAGLFEDLIYAEDINREIDDEMMDIEAAINDGSYQDGNNVAKMFQKDSMTGNSMAKKNAFRDLNARNNMRVNNEGWHHAFGMGNKHTGSTWW